MAAIFIKHTSTRQLADHAQTLSKHRQLYYYCGGYDNKTVEEEEEEKVFNNYETVLKLAAC